MNTETNFNIPALLFYSYSHKDEVLRDELAVHPKTLERFSVCQHDRKILVGEKWKEEISKYLDESDIILLLISSDFISSEYLSGIEVKRALERYKNRRGYFNPDNSAPCNVANAILR